MSTPSRGGPDVPEKKKGLLSRMKTLMTKKRDGSKRASLSSKPAPEPNAEASTSKSATQPQPDTIAESTAKPDQSTQLPPGGKKILRSQIDADRAKRLGERFAVQVEPFNTEPDAEALRVEKPIRMRIHRTCHVCQTTFGNNRICAQCEHPRCKSCLRYPTKKTAAEKAEKERARQARTTAVGDERIEPDIYHGFREQMVLTRQNPKWGGQPLVRKKPKQRVRRTCCGCAALFRSGARTCEGCEHVRCADCPREPAKRHKYPDGYPGDAPSSDTSKPVKYLCHKCNKVFPPLPHPTSDLGIARQQKIEDGDEKELECTRCKHTLCGDCPRAMPRKMTPERDPEVLEEVREKLKGLRVAETV